MISGLFALSCVHCAPALANDDDNWWFDIEVILFSRDTPINELPELFTRQAHLAAPNTQWDLLTRYYQPDVSWIYNSLPECGAPTSPLWVDKPSIEEIINQYAKKEEPETLNNTQTQHTDTQSRTDALRSPEPQSLASVPSSSEIEPSSQPQLQPEPPPSPSAIAQYWIESLYSTPEFTPVEVTQQPINCVVNKTPHLTRNENGLHWAMPDLFVPPVQQTPLLLHGADWARSSGPHLLSPNQLTQNDIFTSIRWRKGIDRLAHFAWRQHVKTGKNNAEKLRLFGGKNYAKQFFETGLMRPVDAPIDASEALTPLAAIDIAQQDTFFEDLHRNLLNPKPIDFTTMMAGQNNLANIEPVPDSRLLPIWQLDGFIQIYLKYLNRVPYLHINSELFYRQPVLTATSGGAPQYELVSVPFTQLRRVISKQLHYFDHPLFGMVVQIRRYNRPAKTTAETANRE